MCIFSILLYLKMQEIAKNFCYYHIIEKNKSQLHKE